ncbi:MULTISPECIES: hypothetical protein [unclassified Shewanella]|uniref:hypothetical protein n=1 Tax=unclassified Shewanella TaxID=196818 RepID=UPI003553C29B
MEVLNKLVNPPSSNSNNMRAYMQAILEVTGLMSGQKYPLEKFMSNYATHLKPKEKFPYPTLNKNSEGMYNLTPEGVRFFSSRLTGEPIIKGQSVTRDEVINMIKCLVADSPRDGWVKISV